MRPLRQINFFVGLLLLIVGGSALAYGLRNMAVGFRQGGLDAALHAPNGSIDGALGLVLVIVGLAMLRSTLRRRLPRLIVIVFAVLTVVLAVHAGYVA